MVYRMIQVMVAGCVAAWLVGCRSDTSRGEKEATLAAAETTAVQTPTAAVSPPAADAGEIPEPPHPGPAPRELWEESLKPTLTDEELLKTLIVSIEADVESGPAPLVVTFGCDLLEEDIESPSFEWDFGDGTPRVTGQTPTHTYTKPGTYTARVVVTDAQGNRGTDEVEIEVEEAGEGAQPT